MATLTVLASFRVPKKTMSMKKRQNAPHQGVVPHPAQPVFDKRGLVIDHIQPDSLGEFGSDIVQPKFHVVGHAHHVGFRLF
jgi:hypothetical protein